MTAESTVTMTALCPTEACGRLVTWTGAVAPVGGGTSWRVQCPCDKASSDKETNR